MNLLEKSWYAVALCLSLVTVTIQSSNYFVASPGLTKAYPGSNVGLIWILDQPLNYNKVLTFQKQSSVPAKSNQFVTLLEGQFGPPISKTDKYSFLNQSDEEGYRYGFSILNVQREDAGNYVINHDLMKDDNATLFVWGTPTTPNISASLEEPVIDKSLVLTCPSTSTSFPESHRTTLRFKWFRNGENQVGDRSDKEQENTLEINPLTRSDINTSYSCQAYEEGNELESNRSEAFLIQPVYGPVKINITPAHVEVGENATVEISCSALCSPRPCSMFWRNTTGLLGGTNPLGFTSIRRDDAGNYTCYAQNKDDRAKTIFQNVTVVVQYPPEVNIYLKDKETIIRKGDLIVLVCAVDAVPKASVRLVQQSLDSRPATGQGQIEIQYTADCFQTYVCEAENPIGQDIKEISPEVVCPPFVVERNPDSDKTTTVVVGQSTTFTVKFKAFPNKFAITWYLYGHQLVSDSNRTINTSDSTSSLTIWSVRENTDYGKYTCTASHVESGENKTVAFYLNVKSKPEPATNLNFNQTLDALYVWWIPGSDGGFPQSFNLTIESSDSNETVIYTIGAEDVPLTDDGFLLYRITRVLALGVNYTATLQSFNQLGHSSITEWIFIHPTTVESVSSGQSDVDVLVISIVPAVVVVLFVLVVVVAVLKLRKRKDWKVNNHNGSAKKTDAQTYLPTDTDYETTIIDNDIYGENEDTTYAVAKPNGTARIPASKEEYSDEEAELVYNSVYETSGLQPPFQRSFDRIHDRSTDDDSELSIVDNDIYEEGVSKGDQGTSQCKTNGDVVHGKNGYQGKPNSTWRPESSDEEAELVYNVVYETSTELEPPSSGSPQPDLLPEYEDMECDDGNEMGSVDPGNDDETIYETVEITLGPTGDQHNGGPTGDQHNAPRRDVYSEVLPKAQRQSTLHEHAS